MPEDPLKQPRLELLAAKRALDDMQKAKSIEEFEMEWRVCLNHLEKVWQKTERCCQHIRSEFEPWQSQFHKLRKKDMLLRYLKQARDADNHSIQDIAKLQPGSRGYKFLNPRGGYIKRMEIRNGEVVHYEGDPMIVEERPPQPIAVSVKNNGEWFNPPTTHMGSGIESPNPVLLADLGIKFYSDYLGQVQKKFFGTSA